MGWCAAFGLLLVFPGIARSDDLQLQGFGSAVTDHYLNTNCCGMAWDLHWVNFRNALRETLSTGGWTESQPFPRDETAWTDANMKTGPANRSDTVDLFLWTGHSFLGDGVDSASPHLSYGHTTNPGICECTRPCANVTHQEFTAGANDNEVAVIFTCEFLRNWNQPSITNEIKGMMQGSHLILGFASMSYCTIYEGCKTTPHDAGHYLGRKLLGSAPTNPVTISGSWMLLTSYYQPRGVVGRALLWLGDCDHDYLQGNWRYGEPNYGYGAQPPACNGLNYAEFDFISQVSP